MAPAHPKIAPAKPLNTLQEFLILAVVLIFLVFLHKVLSPLVELPRLPEHWIGLKEATAQTIFKDDLRCCEDLVVDHECGYAVISSDSGRVFWNALWVRYISPVTTVLDIHLIRKS